MSADFDVAVVGAGVHGAAAAYHLARRGLRTVVIERGHPADGVTTGRSSAICRAFYTNDYLAHVAAESLAVFADFENRVGGPAGFHTTGALFLHGPAEVDAVVATAEQLRGGGIDVELMSAAALRQRHPGVDDRGVALAVWEAGAGYADPVLTTTSYITAARQYGAVVRLKTPVRALTPGTPVSLVIGDEAITARRVLVAAGPWTRDLLATCDVTIPTHAERHVVVSMADATRTIPHVVADTVTGWYGKPDVGGQYLIGGLTPESPVEADAVDGRISAEEQMSYAGLLVDRFPVTAECGPSGGWAGVYDVSPDWQPIIGEVAPNVVVDCGSSGHGFKLAPVLGDAIAGLIAGEQVPGLAQFHPRRFSEGRGLAAGFGDARILG